MRARNMFVYPCLAGVDAEGSLFLDMAVQRRSSGGDGGVCFKYIDKYKKRGVYFLMW